MNMKKIIAGFCGAIALNILHETLRKNFGDVVPHVNELGEEALQKGLGKIGMQISDPDKLYAATLAGDILSNGIYYATAATNKAGIASGLMAGIGAVALPEKMGLDDQPVAENMQKKLMTVGYYIFGAWVTKCVYDKIK